MTDEQLAGWIEIALGIFIAIIVLAPWRKK